MNRTAVLLVLLGAGLGAARGQELLSNTGFEGGSLTGWSRNGAGSMTSFNSGHSGSWSCLRSGRTSVSDGINQTITTALNNNGQGDYAVSAWVFLGAVSTTGRIEIELTDEGGTRYIDTTNGLTGGAWSQVTGTVNLTWGALSSARFFVNTAVGSSTTNIYIDDCSLQRVTVDTPTIAPDSGVYTDSVAVTVTCATADSTIYYTTNGATPTTDSTPYSAPFILTGSAVVKAIGAKSQMANSAVASADYTIVGASQVVTPTITPNGGSFTGSVQVTLASVTAGATIYFTTNGATPTTNATPYGAPFTLNASGIVKAVAVKSGMTDSAVASAAFTLAVATPTFSPDGGEFVGSVEVALACETAGATIHFTTNGATPTTESSVYGAPFTLTADATVKAMAAKSGMTDSAVASAAFAMVSSGSVLNGSFEYGTNGWTVSATDADPPNYAVVTNEGTTAGAHALALNGAVNTNAGNAVFAQTLATASGAVYEIRFDYGAFGNPLQQVLRAEVLDGGAVVTSLTATASGPGWGDFNPAHTTFKTYTNVFTARSFETVIRFTDQTTLANATNVDGVLDNVRAVGRAAAPSLSPNGGSFQGSVTVTATCATAGATIYYTTNGDTPTAGSLQYSAPFTLTSNATVKAVAAGSGLSDSAVTSAVFTVSALPLVDTPTIAPNGGSSNDAVEVTLACGTPGAAIYYTTNGAAPTTNSTLYGAPFILYGSATVKAIGVKSGMADSAVVGADFSIAIAVPAIAPNGGDFIGSVAVALACATPGTTIYYTTNGIAPTAGDTPYAGPFTLYGSATVKAMAAKSGMANSVVASADFTEVPPYSILNGSFEQGTNGWTVAGSAYLVRGDQGHTDGTNALTLNGNNAAGDAVFEQTVATVAGVAYTLRFDYWVYGPKFQQVKAEVLDGATVITNTTAQQTGAGNYGITYLHYALSFAAVSEATTIRFTDLTTLANSVSADGGLDNVRLNSTVATPTIVPNGGSFTGSVEVTLACATPGATIRYTSDGTVPGTAAGTYVAYAGPFRIGGGTVKAYGYRDNDVDSAVASASFTNAASEPWALANVPGRIEAENYRAGDEGIAYHDATVGNAGHVYRADNVDIEICSDIGGGYDVGWTETVGGEWLEYDINVKSAGVYDFVFRVASGVAGTKTIRASIDGNTVAVADYKAANSWSVYYDTMIPGVSLTAGAHVLRVTFETGRLNFNYLDVVSRTERIRVPGRVEAENFRPGGQGVGYFENTPASNLGNAYRLSEGVDIEVCSDEGGGYNTGNIQLAGEWLAYNIFATYPGKVDFVFRVASAVEGDKTLHAEIDGETVATGTFADADGWQSFHNLTVTNVSMTAGAHELKVLFDTESINLNYIDIVGKPLGGVIFVVR